MRRLSPAHGLLLATATLLLLLLPGTATAYLTPEQVLFQGAGYTTLKPPNHRTTGERIDEQERVSTERRAQEQRENSLRQHPLKAAAEAASSVDTQAASSKATLEDVLSGLQESIDRLGQEDRHDAAGEEALEGDTGMTIAPWEDPARGYGSDRGDVLHSGAPLTPTGPETWMAAAAIVGATGWTLWCARMAESRTKR